MIAVVYTGDIRHNQVIAQQNHQKFFNALKLVAPYQRYDFTRNDPERGQCPYDPPPEQADPDNVYRRGFGGAVQVWDFMRGVDRTDQLPPKRARESAGGSRSSRLSGGEPRRHHRRPDRPRRQDHGRPDGDIVRQPLSLH